MICGRGLNNSGGFFDVPKGREELNRIEAQASAPAFWNDQEAAQKLLQERSRLEKLPPYTSSLTTLPGRLFEIVDAASFLEMYDQIWERGS